MKWVSESHILKFESRIYHSIPLHLSSSVHMSVQLFGIDVHEFIINVETQFHGPSSLIKGLCREQDLVGFYCPPPPPPFHFFEHFKLKYRICCILVSHIRYLQKKNLHFTLLYVFYFMLFICSWIALSAYDWFSWV